MSLLRDWARDEVLVAEPTGQCHRHPFGAHTASGALIARPDGILLTATDAFHSSLRRQLPVSDAAEERLRRRRPRAASYPPDVLELPPTPDRSPPPPRRRPPPALAPSAAARPFPGRPPRSPALAPRPAAAAPLGSPASVANADFEFPALALDGKGRASQLKRARCHSVDDIMDGIARVSTNPPFAFVDTCRVAPAAKRLRSFSVDELVDELVRIPDMDD